MPTKLKTERHLETAHVLFIDVVGYSKLLVNEQREVVQKLNQLVRKTPQFRKSDAAGKLIRIQTGDGMALVFFQSPEEPVHCAMEIARALKNHPDIQLRIGVHSGPVDQITDLNDQTNVAGVGINFAQRVMDCGDAGHILVSKRVADDLAQDRLWQPLLHELGEIEVKHGVKLGIVNLYTEELGNPHAPAKLSRRTAIATQPITSSSETASKAPEKSIAVLPFENLSADPENTFFADAVQDEILTDLAKIADLKVISRTSVMQYKSGVKRNLREIASELGVAHIVEGSVQPAGNRVRVRAQLIDARTDMHLWAERYDRPLDDVFAIQTDIAKAIADQLQAKLSPAEKAAIEQQPTADLVAYDRYLRANKLLTLTDLDARAAENIRQAIRLLEQAVAHDPTFLLAYCRAAYAHNALYFAGFDHSPARLALANETLNAALRLGGARGEPHLAAAYIHYQCYRDYEHALDELALARRELPNEHAIFELTGYIARRQGRWEECIRDLEQAAELDPRNVYILRQVSNTYHMLRRFSDMANFYDRTLAIDPSDAMTRVARELVDLECRADTRTGHKAVDEILAEDPSASEVIAEQWFHLALCEHDSAGARRALASMSPEGVVPFNVRYSRSFLEGLAARVRGDVGFAETAFTAARAEMEKIISEQPDFAEGLCLLGMIDAGLGRKEDALREGSRAVELFPVAKDAVTGAELLRNLAIIYAWTGEEDLAFEQLETLVQIPGPISYGQLRLHPWWDPLRDDPRFEKLVAKAAEPVATA